MSADPAQVLRILDIRGIDVRHVAGGLKMRSRTGDMPADMASFVAHFKPLIVAELQERGRLAQTVRNVMALSDADYRQWTNDVLDTPPEYKHDRRTCLACRGDPDRKVSKDHAVASSAFARHREGQKRHAETDSRL